MTAEAKSSDGIPACMAGQKSTAVAPDAAAAAAAADIVRTDAGTDSVAANAQWQKMSI
jgi:hypothetical protein